MPNDVHLELAQNRFINRTGKEDFYTEVYRSLPNSDILRLERQIQDPNRARVGIRRQDIVHGYDALGGGDYVTVQDDNEKFIEKGTRLFDPAYDQNNPNFVPYNVKGIKEFRDNALVWGGTNDPRTVVSSRRFSASGIRGLEFALGFSRSFPDEVVSVNRLDNAAVVFTKTKLFLLDALSFITGLGAPEEIQMADGVGPLRPEAVLEFELGVIWKGPSGFYRLDRGKSVSYIGKSIEDFNDKECVKSVYSAKNREMYFLLDSGETLVLNLDFMRWSVVGPEKMVTDIGLVKGERMHLIDNVLVEESSRSSSLIQENEFETTWISLDGIEGYMRLKRLVILAQAEQGFNLGCQVMYNYDDKNTGSQRTLPLVQGFNQHRIVVDVQKCTSFKLRFSCNAGCNFSINGITIIYAAIGKNELKVTPSG